MVGSEKQQNWARRLYKQLYEAHQVVEAKAKEESGEVWKKTYAYSQGLVDKYADEGRAWVIIDALKGLSQDSAKAANQLKYRAVHGVLTEAEKDANKAVAGKAE